MYKHLQKDFNFEFYKGGSAPPPQPDYNAQAEADIKKQDHQAQIDAERAGREANEKVWAAKKERQKSNKVVRGGYQDAMNYGTNQLNTKGLTGTEYGDEIANLYKAELQGDRKNGLNAANVKSADEIYTDADYDTAYNTVKTGARNKNMKSIDEFLGDGFEQSTFADTMDDSILETILGEQKKDTMSQLDQSRARGLINDVGYNQALKDVDNAEKAGRSQANTLGQGVISKYRKEASDFSGGVHKKLDNFDLTDDFNTDAYRTQFNDMVTGKQTSLEGDIRAALGGTKFFDNDTILQSAGGHSGVQNNTGSYQTSPLTANTSGTSPLTQAYATQPGGNTMDDEKKNSAF